MVLNIKDQFLEFFVNYTIVYKYLDTTWSSRQYNDSDKRANNWGWMKIVSADIGAKLVSSVLNDRILELFKCLFPATF